ncbi:head-tail adaptor protein [Achromobacter mucicolens]|uniref:head-tail adaptor protein n=1 Tax=Achromobacter mucicolens TaxID=1389922 RepID=UPI00244C5778|nr:head-tail adaptor protein [Achromobacter mucicolens]MDH1522543.1 head-tail adaptor protein [Achromobacter mucicolens]
MTARARNRRILIQRRSDEVDAAGQPLDEWVDVGEIWAGIANETGLGAIRSSLLGHVSQSIARYSFAVSFEAARALGIDAGMRALHDGDAFEIKGVTRDFKDRRSAFVICEQGGNDG